MTIQPYTCFHFVHTLAAHNVYFLFICPRSFTCYKARTQLCEDNKYNNNIEHDRACPTTGEIVEKDQ